MRRRIYVLGFAAAIFALLVAAATSARGQLPTRLSSEQSGIHLSPNTPAPKGPISSIKWALYAEPSSLDWIYANDFPPLEVEANVCESLGVILPNYKIAPALATSWSNPNPLTLVYQIRPNVKFHDGSTLTADDVAYSLNRNLDKSLGSFEASNFANVASITATGPLQVTIKLKKPDALLPEELATEAGRVDSKAFIEAHGKSYGTPSVGVDCTGPFSFVSWTKGQSITIQKFAGYWNKSRIPKVGQIEYDFIADPAARVNALLSGAIDGTYQVPSDAYSKLMATSAGKLYFGQATGSYVGMVANLTGPLKDVRIRQALSMVTDRTGIIKSVLDGAAQTLKAPASPGTWGYSQAAFKAAYAALPTPNGSVAAARRLVQTAGAPKKPITIAITTSRPEQTIIAAQMQSAAKQIGLKVQIKNFPASGYNALYSDAKARRGIDIIFSLWSTRFPDPLSIYQFLRGDNFYGFAKWNDPVFMKATSLASATSNDSKRAALLITAQKRAVASVIWIPLYSPYNPLFLSNRITGAPTSAVNLTYSWGADLGAKG